MIVWISIVTKQGLGHLIIKEVKESIAKNHIQDQGSVDEERSQSYRRSRSWSSSPLNESRIHQALTYGKNNLQKSSSKRMERSHSRSLSRSVDLPSLIAKQMHSTPKNTSQKTGESVQAKNDKDKFPMTEASK